MTDNEIIKALDDRMYCGKWIGKGFLDKKDFQILKNALDLINRQQAENINLKAHLEQLKSRYDNAKAEIDRLERYNEILTINADTAFQDGLNEAQDLYAEQIKDEVKAEAIKEFVEKLKEDLKSNNYIVSFDRIDNLVKEMVSEE